MLKKRVLKAMIKDNLVFLAEFNSIKTGNGTKPRNIVTVLKYIKSFDSLYCGMNSSIRKNEKG